jgi:hypothetical protein
MGVMTSTAGDPIGLAAALVAGKKVPPDVTGLLAEDHRTVLGWFRWYAQCTDATIRRRLTRRICGSLRAHMTAEEQYLYRAVDDRDESRELVGHAFAEHADAKTLMERLEAEPAEQSTVDSLVAQLEAEIVAHVAEEESRLFPVLRRANVDLYGLGSLVAARRVEQLLAMNGARRSDVQDADYI